ncbi:hypothetical protein [Vibrio sp. TBV020]|uniref:hypothetical protein n=1 Tax=Vibrio sp. TBV020 TaxID=3137398 RepID=UPI0038CD19E5
MAVGILGGMLRGGGQGVRENARQSIEDQERLRQEQAEDEKYQTRLADERADRDAHYAKVRADKEADLEAGREHDLALAKLRNQSNKSGNRSNTLLANRVKSFENQGAKYLESIDKISTDSMMTPEQKLSAAAPLYARLDELVENNPDMVELSPLFSSFHSSAKGFLTQFEQPTPEPEPDQTATNMTDDFVIPVKNDSSTVSNRSTAETEYLERSGPLSGILKSMRLKPSTGQQTADMEQLQLSGNVRPF